MKSNDSKDKAGRIQPSTVFLLLSMLTFKPSPLTLLKTQTAAFSPGIKMGQRIWLTQSILLG